MKRIRTLALNSSALIKKIKLNLQKNIIQKKGAIISSSIKQSKLSNCKISLYIDFC